MKIAQSFTVDCPLDTVWAAFQDVPSMAQCLPGAALTADKGGGIYAGRVETRLGPFTAAFEGEASVVADRASHSGRVEGKGVDKRGGSRSRLLLDYRLTEVERQTRVDLSADVTLSGPIAQFGRTGLLVETSNILIREFVACLERKLAAATAGEAAAVNAGEVKGLSLLYAAVVAWLKRLFGTRRDS
jgi:carbon-monoxide dehydrogenase small subunit